jgi:CRISPR/Cas system-associated exonuclease Cas4 (RecB family)
MLYGGFRTEVHYGGWVKAGVYGALKQSCEEELLSRRIDTARQIAADTVAAIRAGEIAPRPADLTKCAYCQFASMCRVEVESEKVTGA